MVGKRTDVVQRGARFAAGLAPAGAVEAWKSGVAGEVTLDLGQIQDIGARQRVAVERFAADHKNRLGKAHARERVIERWRELDVRYQRATAAGDDEVLPPGKRLAERFPGTP